MLGPRKGLSQCVFMGMFTKGWEVRVERCIASGLNYFEEDYTLYLLTSSSRVLLGKLTGYQPVKKFPAFYGTRKFTTGFTRARHLSLL